MSGLSLVALSLNLFVGLASGVVPPLPILLQNAGISGVTSDAAIPLLLKQTLSLQVTQTRATWYTSYSALNPAFSPPVANPIAGSSGDSSGGGRGGGVTSSPSAPSPPPSSSTNFPPSLIRSTVLAARDLTVLTAVSALDQLQCSNALLTHTLPPPGVTEGSKGVHATLRSLEGSALGMNTLFASSGNATLYFAGGRGVVLSANPPITVPQPGSATSTTVSASMLLSGGGALPFPPPSTTSTSSSSSFSSSSTPCTGLAVTLTPDTLCQATWALKGGSPSPPSSSCYTPASLQAAVRDAATHILTVGSDYPSSSSSSSSSSIGAGAGAGGAPYAPTFPPPNRPMNLMAMVRAYTPGIPTPLLVPISDTFILSPLGEDGTQDTDNSGRRVRVNFTLTELQVGAGVKLAGYQAFLPERRTEDAGWWALSDILVAPVSSYAYYSFGGGGGGGGGGVSGSTPGSTGSGTAVGTPTTSTGTTTAAITTTSTTIGKGRLLIEAVWRAVASRVAQAMPPSPPSSGGSTGGGGGGRGGVAPGGNGGGSVNPSPPTITTTPPTNYYTTTTATPAFVCAGYSLTMNLWLESLCTTTTPYSSTSFSSYPSSSPPSPSSGGPSGANGGVATTMPVAPGENGGSSSRSNAMFTCTCPFDIPIAVVGHSTLLVSTLGYNSASSQMSSGGGSGSGSTSSSPGASSGSGGGGGGSTGAPTTSGEGGVVVNQGLIGIALSSSASGGGGGGTSSPPAPASSSLSVGAVGGIVGGGAFLVGVGVVLLVNFMRGSKSPLSATTASTSTAVAQSIGSATNTTINSSGEDGVMMGGGGGGTSSGVKIFSPLIHNLATSTPNTNTTTATGNGSSSNNVVAWAHEVNVATIN